MGTLWGIPWNYFIDASYDSIIGGRRGWRPPTLDELSSLVYERPITQSEPELPTGHPFINVQNGYYWTTTTRGNEEGAYGLSFIGQEDGVVKFESQEHLYYVWPVRGGND
jgi:hypothetical protein